MAIELRNRLTSLLGRPLSATLTFNYPTVEKLAAFFLAETRSAPEPVPPRVPGAGRQRVARRRHCFDCCVV